MSEIYKRPSAREFAQLIRDYSQNGQRGITVICDNRKPMRHFVVTYVSEEAGGYVAGREKEQRRVVTIKFADIKEVRI